MEGVGAEDCGRGEVDTAAAAVVGAVDAIMHGVAAVAGSMVTLQV